MYDKRRSAFTVRSHVKVECIDGKTGNLPGGLLSQATINFPVFLSNMINLSVIYTYSSCYLVLLFLQMEYAVIESRQNIFDIIYDYLKVKLSEQSLF